MSKPSNKGNAYVKPIAAVVTATLSTWASAQDVQELSVTKAETKTESKKATAAFSVANAKNDIKFFAYKTTEKVGVAGWFKKVNVTSGGEGNSVKEAINNTEFSIPRSSSAR